MYYPCFKFGLLIGEPSICFALCDSVTLTFDLKIISSAGYPNVIP